MTEEERIEVMIEAICKYEELYGNIKIHKNSKLKSVEYLIEGLAMLDETKKLKFFNYSSKNNFNLAMRNTFKNKPSKVNIYNYLLQLINVKICSKCKNIKNVKEFSYRIRGHGNLESNCRECGRIAHKKGNYSKLHKEKYPEKYTAYHAKERAAKLNRTPKWLTDEDLRLMEEVYFLARLRAEKTDMSWHVDHIIPLRGKLVSGLHVLSNLQVITATENLSKSNKYNVSI
jgi:hypothetical protein